MLRLQQFVAGLALSPIFSAVPLLATENVARAEAPAYFRHERGLAADDNRAYPDALEPAQAVWRTALPEGQSTPTLAGDRIFLTGYEPNAQSGNELLTLCLDRASGKELWRRAVTVDKLEKFHQEGGPASATVACHDGRVFAFFGSYGLVCYDVDGKQLWSRKMGPFRDEFGSSSSPVLVDGKVVLCEDHDLDSFIIALRQDNGETVWETPREGFTRSYATPVVWDAGGRKELIVAGSLQLVSYDAETGKQLWARDGFARIVNTTPTPAGAVLYIATWSPGGDTDARIAMETWDAALGMWDASKDGLLQNAELPEGEVRSRFFRIDLSGDETLDKAEWEKYAAIFERAQNTMAALRPADGTPPSIVWEYKRGLPYVASPLVYRNQVVLVKDGGIVTVLDAADGSLLKQARSRGEGNYYASPVAADGKIYVSSGNGVVTVFRQGKKLEIIGSHDFQERIAATPVLADGRVYLRTAKGLYCFGGN
jgi:outer membrane protein assembly factor BamB